jgi:hypothetical protein
MTLRLGLPDPRHGYLGTTVHIGPLDLARVLANVRDVIKFAPVQGWFSGGSMDIALCAQDSAGGQAADSRTRPCTIISDP